VPRRKSPDKPVDVEPQEPSGNGTSFVRGFWSGNLSFGLVSIPVSLITAQRYFQANAKAIDTATQISQTVINLRT
jgi:flagellar basal body rod protein FlgC